MCLTLHLMLSCRGCVMGLLYSWSSGNERKGGKWLLWVTGSCLFWVLDFSSIGHWSEIDPFSSENKIPKTPNLGYVSKCRELSLPFGWSQFWNQDVRWWWGGLPVPWRSCWGHEDTLLHARRSRTENHLIFDWAFTGVGSDVQGWPWLLVPLQRELGNGLITSERGIQVLQNHFLGGVGGRKHLHGFTMKYPRSKN